MTRPPTIISPYTHSSSMRLIIRKLFITTANDNPKKKSANMMATQDRRTTP